MTATTREQRTDARRAQLLASAARLFHRHGFHGVGIDDIGAAAGVSGPAVYRHFPGKQALLAAITDAHLDLTQERLAAARDAAHPRPLLEATVSAALADPDGLVVCTRQAHWLDHAGQERLRERRGRLGREAGAGEGALWAADAAAARPADLLRSRAAAGALISLALSRTAPAQVREQVAGDMARAVLGAWLPPSAEFPVPASTDARTGLPHASRREAVLAAATRLFRERGFRGVSLRDIGAETGITASAVNRHFDSKEQLLDAAFHRGAEQIAGGIAVALARSPDARTAVREILDRYARLAADCRDLIVISTTELHSLPAGQQRDRRQHQRVYVEELRHVLGQAYPGLSKEETGLRSAAVFALVNEVVMDDELIRRPALADELAALAVSAAVPPSA